MFSKALSHAADKREIFLTVYPLKIFTFSKFIANKKSNLSASFCQNTIPRFGFVLPCLQGEQLTRKGEMSVVLPKMCEIPGTGREGCCNTKIFVFVNWQ